MTWQVIISLRFYTTSTSTMKSGRSACNYNIILNNLTRNRFLSDGEVLEEQEHRDGDEEQPLGVMG